MIEVNGIKYEKIAKRSIKVPSGRMAQLLMATMMMSIPMMGGGREPERPDVDIIEEFGLIQLKKSKLSRNNRDWVVSEFNKNFKAL